MAKTHQFVSLDTPVATVALGKDELETIVNALSNYLFHGYAERCGGGLEIMVKDMMHWLICVRKEEFGAVEPNRSVRAAMAQVEYENALYEDAEAVQPDMTTDDLAKMPDPLVPCYYGGREFLIPESQAEDWARHDEFEKAAEAAGYDEFEHAGATEMSSADLVQLLMERAAAKEKNHD